MKTNATKKKKKCIIFSLPRGLAVHYSFWKWAISQFDKAGAWNISTTVKHFDWHECWKLDTCLQVLGNFMLDLGQNMKVVLRVRLQKTRHLLSKFLSPGPAAQCSLSSQGRPSSHYTGRAGAACPSHWDSCVRDNGMLIYLCCSIRRWRK